MQQIDEARPYGVGGWLGFLVFQLMFIVPFLNFMIMQSAMDSYPFDITNNIKYDAWINIKITIYITLLTEMALSFSAGVLLLSTYKIFSVNYTIFVLFFGKIISLFSTILTVWFLEDANLSGDALAQFVRESVPSSVGPVIWSMYLLGSKRVENTYNEGISEGALKPV